jgi:methionyl-tRNA formyltransferase
VQERPLIVVFMGSPEFAVPTLDAIASAPNFHVVQVVTQPDRPKGRGKRLAPTPVRERAASRGLPVITMTKHDYAEVVRRLAAFQPDFVVVASFGIILKKNLLDLPRYGCVNLHPSLLPRYRGVSPIQAAILAGDERTGCTTMLMDEGVDTGPVLLAESTAIDPRETAGTLERRLASLGAPLVVNTLEGMVSGAVQPVPQSNDLASYTRKIKKEHGAIDWSASAATLSRHIRAMTPWPSAYSRLMDKRVIVLEAEVIPSVAGEPGVIASLSPLVVATGDGGLELLRLKIEGKTAMDAAAFLSGYRVEPGDRFE